SLYDTFLLHTSLKDININDMADRHLGSELEADLCVALALHPPQRLIIDYMVIEKGFQFKAQHLELAQLTFDRELVQYVRQHLSPDVDGDDDPEPNDCDLACLVIDAVHFQDVAGAGVNIDCCAAVVQFLLDYPHMIDKMYFLVDYLQNANDYQPLQPAADPAPDTAFSESFSSSDEPDEVATPMFYRPELAAQLIDGLLDQDGKESPSANSSAAADAPIADAPIASEPLSVPSWVDTQLLHGRSNTSFIERVKFMCGLVTLDLDQRDPGLQRWDLIERHNPGPDR
ncbi:hypothetical protein BVRB_022170, partial [Beta vulgaris subsp. vulgaris]